MLKVNHNNLPEAVETLLSKVEILEKILNKSNSQEVSNNEIKERKIVRFPGACKILDLKPPTVYCLVRKRKLKSYKAGKMLYFYEDELIEYMTKNSRKTTGEILETAEQYSRR